MTSCLCIELQKNRNTNFVVVLTHSHKYTQYTKTIMCNTHTRADRFL